MPKFLTAGKEDDFARMRATRRRNYFRNMRQSWQLYTFILIPIIWLIIFKYYPMYGAQIAFRNFKLKRGLSFGEAILASPWVGTKYFKQFFDSVYFGRTVGNTIFLSLYAMAVNFPLPILFALLLNSVREKKYRGVIENATYMPHFISAVVMVGILYRVFDPNTGLIVNLLKLLTGKSRIDFNMLIGNSNFRNLYIWSGVWQETGWASIIYMAALSSVDPQLHEAATVDGASRWQRLWHIDFPAIVPTITITLILRCGSIMSIGFDKVFLMQNDTNRAASDVISTYVYEIGLKNGNQYSYSTAINLFNSVVNLITISTVNFISNRINGSGLW